MRANWLPPLVLIACGHALGQSGSEVTVVGRGIASAGVAGFGNAPLARAPLQAASFGNGTLLDQGVGTLNDVTRLDAGIADAYNAAGYWAQIAVRGYALDTRFNYRRDGLPISAETAIAFDNVERFEVFKGTSGIQAGTSAPGGLVNLVVKRPGAEITQGRLQWRQPGSWLAAVDLGRRFGADGAVAVRINAAAERLDPQQRDSRGSRSVLAVAADWQLAPDTLLQAEIESSRQHQPSAAGFSLRGDAVPPASSIDPRLNLNRQPWRQDVEFEGQTVSLRWQQRLSADWRFVLHGHQQRLKTNDRTAFPYGVYDANYDCPEWCDRFAPDGGFTYWQYVSDDERRTTGALQALIAGRATTGPIEHAIEAGVLATRYRGRFDDQVFDIAGPGRDDGSLVAPPAFGFTDANTDRDERSTEWFVRDAMRIGPDWQLWAGLRSSQIERESVRTSPDGDGSLRPTDITRSAITPWLAVAVQLAPRTMLYGSWGKGLEADVAPNRPRYLNAGESIALASRQFEIGLKHGDEAVEAALTLFDIDRGVAEDIGSCGAAGSCVRARDGSQRHRGLEAYLQQQGRLWAWQTSVALIDAERRGSARSDVNGRRPVNVPAASLRLSGEFRPPPVAGLALQAALQADSDRVVLPYDESVRIPGWWRLDLGARWRQRWAGSTLTWRAGLDNATDRRAWKESPYQFGHAYLYPLAPRTWRVSLTAAY